MPFKEHAPLDPQCPVVEDWQETFFNDPITETCGCADEILSAFEKSHRKKCRRCQEYGAANIEIVEGDRS